MKDNIIECAYYLGYGTEKWPIPDGMCVANTHQVYHRYWGWGHWAESPEGEVAFVPRNLRCGECVYDEECPKGQQACKRKEEEHRKWWEEWAKK